MMVAQARNTSHLKVEHDIFNFTCALTKIYYTVSQTELIIIKNFANALVVLATLVTNWVYHNNVVFLVHPVSL